MSLALIQESAKEVRRLAIAGSPLAVNDFRLKKLVVPLEQAGAKVPVFGQVAKAINDLVIGTEADSAARLLSLSTLLNAILYTQGQTGATGDYRELETFPKICANTRTPARILKPLVQALTTTGGGRLEVIKSACERGAFNDLRLIDPAIQALGDNYPELADLAAEKILPSYGPGIVPRLKATLDLKGKKEHARRLSLMHQLDPIGTLELCKTALEEGSTEVKIAAIACLGEHEECLSQILEQANSKNKNVRAAALEALAAHDRPEISKLFTELIQGKALDLLAKPFRAMRNRQVLKSLLDEGKRVFALLLKGDSEQIPRYCEILNCLEGKKDPEVESFLLDCFSHDAKLAKLKAAKSFYIAGVDLVVRLSSLLYNIGSDETLAAILAKRDVLPSAAFGEVFRGALRKWPEDKVYEEFSPLLKEKKQSADKEKINEIERLIYSASYHRGISVFGEYAPDISLMEDMKDVTWDPRWLDAAIKADQIGIACCLARPGHRGAITYLSKLVGSKNRFSPALVIQALAQCEYPKVAEAFLDLVINSTKNAKHFDYHLQLLFESARHLPKSDLVKLDAFAAKLDEKFIDKYLEALAPLRSAKQPN
jgi:hypothetical protein